MVKATPFIDAPDTASTGALSQFNGTDGSSIISTGIISDGADTITSHTTLSAVLSRVVGFNSQQLAFTSGVATIVYSGMTTNHFHFTHDANVTINVDLTQARADENITIYIKRTKDNTATAHTLTIANSVTNGTIYWMAGGGGTTPDWTTLDANKVQFISLSTKGGSSAVSLIGTEVGSF